MERLLQLSDRHLAPVTLAVIPDADRRDLAATVQGRPLVHIAQHGVDHRNRREPGGLGEFPLAWTAQELADRLDAGWSRLKGLPGAIPVYVPPWNDVHPSLPQALEACGYLAWSAGAGGGRQRGVPRFDADLDLIQWAGGARFKGAGRVLRELRRALQARRREGDWARPIGLLSHHLDHDRATWAFLDRFLAWRRGEPALALESLETLMAARAPWGRGPRRPAVGLPSAAPQQTLRRSYDSA